MAHATPTVSQGCIAGPIAQQGFIGCSRKEFSREMLVPLTPSKMPPLTTHRSWLCLLPPSPAALKHCSVQRIGRGVAPMNRHLRGVRAGPALRNVSSTTTKPRATQHGASWFYALLVHHSPQHPRQLTRHILPLVAATIIFPPLGSF